MAYKRLTVGKTRGSGMKRGKRGVNPKMHRVKNRGGGR